MTGSDWCFSFIGGDAQDDDSDSETGDDNTPRMELSRLQQELDLSCRHETVDFKPNPFNIAKINAASRKNLKKAPFSRLPTPKTRPSASTSLGYSVDAYGHQKRSQRVTNRLQKSTKSTKTRAIQPTLNSFLSNSLRKAIPLPTDSASRQKVTVTFSSSPISISSSISPKTRSDPEIITILDDSGLEHQSECDQWRINSQKPMVNQQPANHSSFSQRHKLSSTQAPISVPSALLQSHCYPLNNLSNETHGFSSVTTSATVPKYIGCMCCKISSKRDGKSIYFSLSRTLKFVSVRPVSRETNLQPSTHRSHDESPSHNKVSDSRYTQLDPLGLQSPYDNCRGRSDMT